MPNIGERIKRRRVELGWTQDTLAQKAGLSKSFLSDIENNKRKVGADKLLDVGRVLGLSLDYLMKGEATPPEREEIPVPASLASFAGEEGLTFRQTLTLLEMRQQIVAHRSTTKKEDLEEFDWRKFYEAVKEFL